MAATMKPASANASTVSWLLLGMTFRDYRRGRWADRLPKSEVSMSLLGKAAVAMWWNIRPEQRAEFGDWHSHEHFPERMSIPGFRRGSRWVSTEDADGFFVLYELEQYARKKSAMSSRIGSVSVVLGT